MIKPTDEQWELLESAIKVSRLDDVQSIGNKILDVLEQSSVNPHLMLAVIYVLLIAGLDAWSEMKGCER